jgi:hypothetical protein
MAIPIIRPAPSDPEVRKRIILDSSTVDLENIRQHSLGTMHALARGNPVHPDYAIWSTFVGEIESEQRKRGENSN